MKNFFKIITDFIADISLDLFAIFSGHLMTVKVASSEAPVKSSILSEKQPAGASAGPYSSILPDHTKVPHRYLPERS